jgi:hypothetical protein
MAQIDECLPPWWPDVYGANRLGRPCIEYEAVHQHLKGNRQAYTTKFADIPRIRDPIWWNNSRCLTVWREEDFDMQKSMILPHLCARTSEILSVIFQYLNGVANIWMSGRP